MFISSVLPRGGASWRSTSLGSGSLKKGLTTVLGPRPRSFRAQNVRPVSGNTSAGFARMKAARLLLTSSPVRAIAWSSVSHHGLRSLRARRSTLSACAPGNRACVRHAVSAIKSLVSSFRLPVWRTGRCLGPGRMGREDCFGTNQTTCGILDGLASGRSPLADGAGGRLRVRAH